MGKTWFGIVALLCSELSFFAPSPGEGNGTPLQYSCLENPMDGGAWKAAVHGVAEGWTQLSDFIFTFHFHALEKEMATHSSVLAWRIAGTGKPGRLPSLGSHRVGHDWSDLAPVCVTLGKLLNFSVPQFPHIHWNITGVPGWLWGASECVKQNCIWPTVSTGKC